MFTLKVRKLFRKSLVSWLTATPQHRKPRSTFKPRLEGLEPRWCPAAVSMYWDPTNGNNANTIVGGQAVNWDKGSLGSGVHPAAAPGNTAGETDNIYFDGTVGSGGNKSCTWNYKPDNNLGAVSFQNGWNQQVTFLSGEGFSVSADSNVDDASAPIITPSGGSGAVAAITLTNGVNFIVTGSLYLTGASSGGAIFFAGDGTSGEYFWNEGKVTYSGQSNTQSQNVDYLKIPVFNEGGTFTVNGGGIQGTGATLQVSGTDSETFNVSFYQSSTSPQTNIEGGGTLWCYNDFRMNAGLLQTTDANLDTLEVGTSSADGTAYIIGGTVNIDAGTSNYGRMQIIGSTTTNNPVVDVGTATLAFKVNAANSTESDTLTVGRGNNSSNGRINFDYNGGTSTVGVRPIGNLTQSMNWTVLYYGSSPIEAYVQFPSQEWMPNWQAHSLQVVYTQPK